MWSTAERKKSDKVLYETMDQSSTVNGVHWYGHVTRKEDRHILKDTKLGGWWKAKGRKGV